MKGRKPAPPQLKIARGERPDRVNRDAPPALPGRPEAPAWLDDTAREEWDRITAEMAELGVLSRADGAALALYCTVFGRWRRALGEIAKENGLAGGTAAGGAKGSPYVAVAEKCETQMGRLLAEFGMTPASRSRVQGAGPAKESKLKAFLGTRKA